MRSSTLPRFARQFRTSVLSRNVDTAPTAKSVSDLAKAESTSAKSATDPATSTTNAEFLNASESTASTTTEIAGKTEAPPNPLRGLMFPWERAVMDGERVEVMSATTKLYWLVFGSALVFVMGSRGWDHYKDKTIQEDPELIKRKQEMLKASVQGALNGQSFLSANKAEDPFEGLTPAEIDELVKKEAPSGDAFDGMSPQEINAYMKKQQMETGLSRRGL
mmetsp:Transcript_16584/g.22890  ORF Transcript_16584/g.22890 Transcript_16584/m.22890 type:complete len:220 (+) Transcript_16584:114-773(+)|eukprot:CAMPEP_0196583810 /NCGR_PEP_ID=MMETSP1081-20130531/44774_1 /TAXON_ID=36882 /ORGANISM="Pyramimonas amylifera, Strain CCMP720" /LENGTH=219 /DNA_ID=CAMNT_0041904815 /DNA_START=114 /DNA_END=773 /DNA_ORIENTATION=-